MSVRRVHADVAKSRRACEERDFFLTIWYRCHIGRRSRPGLFFASIWYRCHIASIYFLTRCGIGVITVIDRYINKRRQHEYTNAPAFECHGPGPWHVDGGGRALILAECGIRRRTTAPNPRPTIPIGRHPGCVSAITRSPWPSARHDAPLGYRHEFRFVPWSCGASPLASPVQRVGAPFIPGWRRMHRSRPPSSSQSIRNVGVRPVSE